MTFRNIEFSKEPIEIPKSPENFRKGLVHERGEVFPVTEMHSNSECFKIAYYIGKERYFICLMFILFII